MARRPSKMAAVIKGSRKPRCRVCGWVPPGKMPATVLHAHHLVPVVAGGPEERSNLVLLCPNHHAIAHELWPWTRSMDTYEGPRTARDLVWLLRAFEADPESYYQATVTIATERLRELVRT